MQYTSKTHETYSCNTYSSTCCRPMKVDVGVREHSARCGWRVTRGTRHGQRAVRGTKGVRHGRVCVAQGTRRGAHVAQGRSGATMRGVGCRGARREARGAGARGGSSATIRGARYKGARREAGPSHPDGQTF
jgi:hypothetical protein